MGLRTDGIRRPDQSLAQKLGALGEVLRLSRILAGLWGLAYESWVVERVWPAGLCSLGLEGGGGRMRERGRKRVERDRGRELVEEVD